MLKSTISVYYKIHLFAFKSYIFSVVFTFVYHHYLKIYKKLNGGTLTLSTSALIPGALFWKQFWLRWDLLHPWRPRGCQSGWEKRRDKRFQAQAEKPLGSDSHRTISKRSSECWFLIGHKKCFVLLCPIGEQHLLSSFREFVHDGYWLDHGLSGSCTKEMHAVRNLSVWYKRYISKYW